MVLGYSSSSQKLGSARSARAKMVVANSLAVLLTLVGFVSGKLSEDYYAQTCPNVEGLVLASTTSKLLASPTTAAAMLRLMFHDCFIEGCDASIMITSTPDNLAERDAHINMDLAGDAFDAIVRSKKAVEEQCPGVVSCADIMAIATRDFIKLTGGPSYTVLKGRKDGRVSKASLVGNNIPDASSKLSQLISLFSSKGLNEEDLVVLSGGHTFGFAHCVQFSQRLYNYSNKLDTDPHLDNKFAQDLKGFCSFRGVDPNVVVPFDPATPFSFDNGYFQQLLNKQALLDSDQSLMTSRLTRRLVMEFARNQDAFFVKFAQAMQKLTMVGVKTGNQGDVRYDCTRFNHHHHHHHRHHQHNLN